MDELKMWEVSSLCQEPFLFLKDKLFYSEVSEQTESQWIVLVHGENENDFLLLLIQNFIELYELLMPDEQFAPKCFHFQEITKHKNFRSPPGGGGGGVMSHWGLYIICINKNA